MPAPAGKLPYLGTAVALLRNEERVVDWLLDLRKQLGPVYQMAVPGQTYLCITDPADVRHILVDNFPNYVKGKQWQERFNEVLGRGIFSVDGDEWRLHRKTSSHMFKRAEFKTNMMRVFRQHMTQLTDMLEQAARTGAVVDMHSLFLRYTLDSIGEIAFGHSINSLGNPSDTFATAFDSAQSIAEKRFYNPLWKLGKLVLPSEATLRRDVRELNTAVHRIIAEKHADPEFAAKSDSVLARFFNLRDDDGKPFPDEFLRDVVMNFLIAGRDTTGQGMSWLLYCLLQNPEAEARCVEEAQRVYGGPSVGDDGLPTYAAFEALDYTYAAFTETLRLYPSVPKDAKFAVRDDPGLPCGVFVPAGTLVIFMPYVAGRDPKLWKEPLQFRPERFLDEHLGGRTKPPATVYPVFNAGKRTCLGQDMAYLEAVTLVSHLLRRFKFKLEPGFVPKVKTSATLPMANGLRVTVSMREDA